MRSVGQQIELLHEGTLRASCLLCRMLFALKNGERGVFSGRGAGETSFLTPSLSEGFAGTRFPITRSLFCEVLRERHPHFLRVSDPKFFRVCRHGDESKGESTRGLPPLQ
jgi:hypothetical protein